MTMARDLSALTAKLTPSAGLDSVDPRLGAMSDLAEEGDFDALGDQVEERARPVERPVEMAA